MAEKAIITDDEGRPYRGLILDSGEVVDEVYYQIYPERARLDPVPASHTVTPRGIHVETD